MMSEDCQTPQDTARKRSALDPLGFVHVLILILRWRERFSAKTVIISSDSWSILADHAARATESRDGRRGATRGDKELEQVYEEGAGESPISSGEVSG